MPEYLVVCCWRSIKEVSLLLGELTQQPDISPAHAAQNAPAQRPGETTLLSIQQVTDSVIRCTYYTICMYCVAVSLMSDVSLDSHA